MSILLWILVIACFVLAFVALVYPIIPGIPLLWVGFLLYHFGIDRSDLPVLFWILQVLFTVFLFVADFLANSYFLKKYGSTKWGERIGMLSILIGSFFFPPFGLLIIPFLFVFLTEILQNKEMKEAFLVAFATVISFLSSSIAKAIIQFIMVAVFFLYIFL